MALVDKFFASLENNNLWGIGALLSPEFKGEGPSEEEEHDFQNYINHWEDVLGEGEEPVRYMRTERSLTTVSEGPDAGDWVNQSGTFAGPSNFDSEMSFLIKDRKIHKIIEKRSALL